MDSHGVIAVVISLAVSVIGEVEEGEGNSTYYSPPGQCLYRWKEYIITIFVELNWCQTGK